MNMRTHLLAFTLALPVSVVVAGCSSTSTPAVDASATDGSEGSGGGPIAGPADTHCEGKKQEVTPAVCQAPAPDGGAGDGGMAEEAPVHFNAEADDDDCKYHMSFTSTPIGLNKDVFFTVKSVLKTDGSAASWGSMDAAEVLTEDQTHPAPDTQKAPVQSPVGTMKFGPVRFDRSGKWIVRFHIHEECTDNDEASQHGHVAFFINVL